MAVVIKRVYDPPSREDGTRVLVDRLWPRGLTKASAAIDEWLRELAPSTELRRWYHAQPNQWAAFRKKYLKELAQPAYQDALHRLFELAHQHKRLTLLFGIQEREYQQCRGAERSSGGSPQATARNRCRRSNSSRAQTGGDEETLTCFQFATSSSVVLRVP